MLNLKIQRTLSILRKKTKLKFVIALILSFINALFELVGITLILPFLTVLLNEKNIYIDHLYSITGVNFYDVNLVSIMFLSAVVLSALVRLFVLRYNLRLGANVGNEICVKLVSSILYSEYIDVNKINKSDIISWVTVKINAIVFNFIIPILNSITALLTVILMSSILLTSNPSVSVIVISIILILYLSISLTVKNHIRKLSKSVALKQNLIVKNLNETFGSVREVFINDERKTRLRKLQDNDIIMRTDSVTSQFIATAPKFILEPLIILMISVSAIIVTNNGIDLKVYLPVIGLYILAFQRLMPLIQTIYNGYTTSKANIFTLNEILENINELSIVSKNKNANLSSNIIIQNLNSLKLDSVSYKYENTNKYIFRNLNLNLKEGDHLAIIGSTGSGKSTLTDIILSLLAPSDGNILVNNKLINQDNIMSYRSNFSVVPQSIFISNCSFVENVVGEDIENVDYNLLEQVITIACLNDLIAEKNGYYFDCGEDGRYLSGGQKQRIVIARALYKDRKILVLDEATSALDKITENKIYENLTSHKFMENKIIISITHKNEVLSFTNKVINMDEKND